MKVFTTVVALSLSSVALQARAAEPNEANHPCKSIIAACKAAGFVKGEYKEHKGLWKDCVDPIVGGQTVTGVNVPADEVTACKAKMAEHKK